MGCMGLLPVLGLVAVLVAVATAVMLAVRHAGPRTGGRAAEPETILGRRLARGEIDADEYHDLAAALRSAGAATGARREGRRA